MQAIRDAVAVVRGLEQIPRLYDPVCALYELFAAG